MDNRNLLRALQQHVELLTAGSHEKETQETRTKINEQSDINKLLESKVKEEEVLNKQIKMKTQIYKKILTERKQVYVDRLIKDKENFEEILNNIHYLQLKLELKETMRRETEVLIDDETRKDKTEKEMIETVERELELKTTILSDVTKKLTEIKQQNEILENELKNQMLKLDQSKMLQFENFMKFTIAEKFNQNILLNRNSLLYVENKLKRERISLNEIRKLNEAVNKKLIGIIFNKNLLSLANGVKVLLIELDEKYKNFYQVGSSGKNNVPNKDLSVRNRTIEANGENYDRLEKKMETSGTDCRKNEMLNDFDLLFETEKNIIIDGKCDNNTSAPILQLKKKCRPTSTCRQKRNADDLVQFKFGGAGDFNSVVDTNGTKPNSPEINKKNLKLVRKITQQKIILKDENFLQEKQDFVGVSRNFTEHENNDENYCQKMRCETSTSDSKYQDIIDENRTFHFIDWSNSDEMKNNTVDYKHENLSSYVIDKQSEREDMNDRTIIYMSKDDTLRPRKIPKKNNIIKYCKKKMNKVKSNQEDPLYERKYKSIFHKRA
ncbi:hypothetical protein M8J76_002824 [Diaphorina citri]|nr:hypothetical protein M8J75_008216 [Diaphorina citri]KAI5722044.1 hypothetical protein M8J76_002824 [Diaphorina citri]